MTLTPENGPEEKHVFQTKNRVIRVSTHFSGRVEGAENRRRRLYLSMGIPLHRFPSTIWVERLEEDRGSRTKGLRKIKRIGETPLKLFYKRVWKSQQESSSLPTLPYTSNSNVNYLKKTNNNTYGHLYNIVN